MKEEWKDIIKYEDRYRISNHGRVFSKINNIFLKMQFSSYGYHIVFLSRKAHSVSRLVASHFLDNEENKPQVAHLDGSRTNNLVTNLTWATQSENELHKVWHGTHHRVLSESEVLDICNRYKRDEPVCFIAKYYGVNRGVIYNVVTKKYYKDIKRDTIVAKRKDTVTSKEIENILILSEEGLSYSKIAKKLNRGKTSVARVIRRAHVPKHF